jgi:hypothetical protein
MSEKSDMTGIRRGKKVAISTIVSVAVLSAAIFTCEAFPAGKYAPSKGIIPFIHFVQPKTHFELAETATRKGEHVYWLKRMCPLLKEVKIVFCSVMFLFLLFETIHLLRRCYYEKIFQKKWADSGGVVRIILLRLHGLDGPGGDSVVGRCQPE